MTQAAGGDARPDAADSRRYPSRPIVGVGAVTFIDGKTLLIRRRFEPMAGHWSLPGGGLELGETLRDGLTREMKEETGLDVEVGPVLDVFDRITRDPDGRVRFHYVLVDYLCRAVGGTLAPGSDVSEVMLGDPADLVRFDLTDQTLDVIRRAMAVADPLAGL